MLHLSKTHLKQFADLKLRAKDKHSKMSEVSETQKKCEENAFTTHGQRWPGYGGVTEINNNA